MSDTKDNNTAIDVSDHEAILQYSQEQRLKISTENTHDPKIQLSALKDLTKTAVDVMRLKVDSDSTDATKDLARSLMAIINENPRTVIDVEPGVEIAPPEVDLGEHELVPGELSVELDEECNFETIVKGHISEDQLDDLD